MPVRFVLIANPAGVGHAWLVRRHAMRTPWKPYVDEATGFDFVTISSVYKDNEFIDRDRYKKNLMASCATDPELGKAWLTGDWSVLRGAYFSRVLEESRVMFEPWPYIFEEVKPSINYRGYRTTPSAYQSRWGAFLTHDFGVAPPSITYLCVRSTGEPAPDGKVYPRNSILLLDEVSITHPDDLNVGLVLPIQDQAERILEMCSRWKVIPRGYADDAIFSRTGSQSGSIAQEFSNAGVHFAKAHKGSRVAGWQKMRRLLANAGRPDMEGLYVSRLCTTWWQTVPNLPRDPRHPEDVDSTAADHAADACRYALVGEPLANPTVTFAL